ncbi:MAG: hypothetical protein QOF24_1602 [Verrucomicrobiota bacterium]|jgi:hypothetical protein
MTEPSNQGPQPLLDPASKDQKTDPNGNRIGLRVGWSLVGVSLLVVISTVLAWRSLSDIRILGVIFGGGGVLSGMIVVFSYSYADQPIDNRHEGVTMVLGFTGMIFMMLALAAAIGTLSLPIAVVAVSLSAFQLWAMFWGARSGSLLALRVLVQLGLIATVFYAVSQGSHGH